MMDWICREDVYYAITRTLGAAALVLAAVFLWLVAQPPRTAPSVPAPDPMPCVVRHPGARWGAACQYA